LDLKKLIDYYLRVAMNEFNGHFYQRAQQKEKNQFTYAVLLMAKTCLEFGFYDSKEEINMLCVSILGFLNGTFDVTTDEEVDLLFPFPFLFKPHPPTHPPF